MLFDKTNPPSEVLRLFFPAAGVRMGRWDTLNGNAQNEPTVDLDQPKTGMRRVLRPTSNEELRRIVPVRMCPNVPVQNEPTVPTRRPSEDVSPTVATREVSAKVQTLRPPLIDYGASYRSRPLALVIC